MDRLPHVENGKNSGEIALCLSGGGYRAAAFHLGVMKTLEKLKMLDRVKYVSTASGGTITAMKYAISRTKGEPFIDFFESMKTFLSKVNVVDEGLRNIDKAPNPNSEIRDLSLIRSAAMIYREKLIGTRIDAEPEDSEWTLQHIYNRMTETNTFRDLIFNSSEFRTGNNFRFRLATERRLVFGNDNTKIDDDLAKQVLLGDVVAASSCFPGVFEPMRFPDDFQFRNREEVTDPFKENTFNFKSISLMDGGILDNQGLYGMTVSYREYPPPFDLMIVSDTSGREEEIYRLKLPARVKSPSVRTTAALLFTLLATLFVCSIWLSWRSLSNQMAVIDLVLTLILGASVLLFSGAGLVGLTWAIVKLKSLNVMGYSFPIWSRIETLKLCDLWILGKSRISSTSAMVFNVFMNRIRSLQFANTMSAVDLDEQETIFNGITVFSFIYTLIPIKGRTPILNFRDNLKPTESMIKIAKAAAKVGTKLWLDEKEQERLIDCGRITICAILLNYYFTNKRFDDLAKPDSKLSAFHEIYLEWLELRKEFA